MEIFMQTDPDVSPPQVPNHQVRVKYINNSHSHKISLSRKINFLLLSLLCCCIWAGQSGFEPTVAPNQRKKNLPCEAITFHFESAYFVQHYQNWKIKIESSLKYGLYQSIFIFFIASKTYRWLICHFRKVKWIGEFETPQISSISSHLLYHHFCNDSKISLTFRKCSKGQKIF